MVNANTDARVHTTVGGKIWCECKCQVARVLSLCMGWILVEWLTTSWMLLVFSVNYLIINSLWYYCCRLEGKDTGCPFTWEKLWWDVPMYLKTSQLVLFTKSYNISITYKKRTTQKYKLETTNPRNLNLKLQTPEIWTWNYKTPEIWTWSTKPQFFESFGLIVNSKYGTFLCNKM